MKQTAQFITALKHMYEFFHEAERRGIAITDETIEHIKLGLESLLHNEPPELPSNQLPLVPSTNDKGNGAD